MKVWIVGIVASAMMVALSQVLMPQGAVRSVGKFLGGLVLILAVIQPVVSWDYEELYVMANGLEDITVEEEGDEMTKTIIEEELSAYVLDKVQEVQDTWDIHFSCVLEDRGELTIATVTVEGVLGEREKLALEETLTEEFGLSLEKLTYSDGESTWN